MAMSVAVLLLVFGLLLPLWWGAGRSDWGRRLARTLGVVVAALVSIICVEQCLGLDLPHNVISLTAGAAAVPPTVLLLRREWGATGTSPGLRAVMGLALAAALVNFLGYAWAQSSGELSPAVPLAQTTSLGALLLWLGLRGQPD